MKIDDDFSVIQAEKNITLEGMEVTTEVKELVKRGRLGEFTTTDIINKILNNTTSYKLRKRCKVEVM